MRVSTQGTKNDGSRGNTKAAALEGRGARRPGTPAYRGAVRRNGCSHAWGPRSPSAPDSRSRFLPRPAWRALPGLRRPGQRAAASP